LQKRVKLFSSAGVVSFSQQPKTTNIQMKKFVTSCCIAAGLMLPMAITSTARADHPEIHGAIEALQKAKFRLQHADHDFGGHRAAALQSVDAALEQLRLALKFDK
jgi:hypothetical protein